MTSEFETYAATIRAERTEQHGTTWDTMRVEALDDITISKIIRAGNGLGNIKALMSEVIGQSQYRSHVDWIMLVKRFAKMINTPYDELSDTLNYGLEARRRREEATTAFTTIVLPPVVFHEDLTEADSLRAELEAARAELADSQRVHEEAGKVEKTATDAADFWYGKWRGEVERCKEVTKMAKALTEQLKEARSGLVAESVGRLKARHDAAIFEATTLREQVERQRATLGKQDSRANRAEAERDEWKEKYERRDRQLFHEATVASDARDSLKTARTERDEARHHLAAVCKFGRIVADNPPSNPFHFENLRNIINAVPANLRTGGEGETAKRDDEEPRLLRNCRCQLMPINPGKHCECGAEIRGHIDYRGYYEACEARCNMNSKATR